MSKSDPRLWMPLWVGSYLKNTQRLTTEQHGAYLLLIMEYWISQGPIKYDLEEIAAITRLSQSQLQPVLQKLLPFFDVVDGHLVHERIETEISKARLNIEKNRQKTEKARQAKLRNKKGTSSVARSVTESVTGCVTGSSLPLPEEYKYSSSVSEEAKSAIVKIFGSKFQGVPDWHTIEGWLNSGFDLDLDVLPVFRGKAARMRKPVHSFAAFTKDVIGHREARTEAQEKKATPIATSGDHALDEKLDALASILSKDTYVSWFEKGDKPIITVAGGGYCVNAVGFRREQIKERFGALLDKVLNKWVFSSDSV